MKKTLTTFMMGMAVLLVATDCMGQRRAFNLPPAQRLLEPGPGVGGPGPGVLSPLATAGSGGVSQAGAIYGGGGCGPYGGCPGGGGGAPITSQIAFLGVEGGEVSWDVSGQQLFDSTPLVMPARQNFYQGAIYRLKLTNLPNREGTELYPTLEVAPVTPRTDAFLAHAPIPIQFTDEDLDQVRSGNFVTKVIYLPDPEFQDLALAGVETLVSTRLDPGVDPIAEADRRGSIMAILRVGNLDLQLPGQGLGLNGSIVPAQYSDGCQDCQNGEVYGGEVYGGEVYGGEYGGMSGAPQGLPTGAMAPQALPPHLISGLTTPQWGMPSVGTPIGLPGPPHIPLGHEAGLVSHSIRNKTRVNIPPPVHHSRNTVRQRPGINYPRPVTRTNVAETNRAGFRLHGGTLPPALPTAFKKLAARCKGDNCTGCPECQ